MAQFEHDSRDMYHHQVQHQTPHQQMPYHHPQMLTVVEPYMYQTLSSLIHHPVVIETIRGTIRGTLADVNPDYVTLEVSSSYYFVRLQQINWVMPSHPHTLPHIKHASQ